MSLAEYLSLFGGVLSDWRTVFITVMMILAWAVLRYVGMVYDRRPRPRFRRPVLRRPRPQGSASQTQGTQAAQESAESGQRGESGERKK